MIDRRTTADISYFQLLRDQSLISFYVTVIMLQYNNSNKTATEVLLDYLK